MRGLGAARVSKRLPENVTDSDPAGNRFLTVAAPGSGPGR